VDAAVKNLREWIVLLIGLFIAFDLAGVQYRMQLSRTAALEPDTLTGRIAELVEGCPDGDGFCSIYVTPDELLTLHGILGAALLALLATLGVIIGHGIAHLHRQKVRRPSP